MADRMAVVLVGEWEAFARALDGRDFAQRLERQLGVASKRMGREFVKVARRKIRARQYTPNSPITVILKGSSAPLVDKGDLFQSITYDASDPYATKVGLIRAKSGNELVNLGIVLHEGATIDTRRHPQVRRAVWAKVRKGVSLDRIKALNRRQNAAVTKAAISLGVSRRAKGTMSAKQRRFLYASGALKRNVSGGSAGSGIWRIPARPFILEPLNDPTFVRFVRDTWAEAVRIALFPD